MLFFVILLVCLRAQISSAAEDTGQIALIFGEDVNSHVSYNPDMRAFTNAYTLCSWIRKRRDGGNPIWATYPSGTDTMIAYDSGCYVFFRYGSICLRSKFSSTITSGVWYHVCLSWSSQGNRARAYWNGTLAGEATTPSGSTLPIGGKLVLGNYYSGHSAHYFGGDIAGLNMYNRELTAEEIRDIAELGYCHGTEELFDDSRILKWEDILLQQRTGDVKELGICDISDTDKLKKAIDELQKTKQTLSSTTQQLNTATDELQETKQTLSSTTQQLNTATDELQETKQTLSSTTRLLNTATQKLGVVAQQHGAMAQCLENKIELEQFVRNKQAKRVIGQFKTCRATKESDRLRPPPLRHVAVRHDSKETDDEV